MQKVTAQVCQYIYVAKQSYLGSYALSSNDELVANSVKMAMEYAKVKPVGLILTKCLPWLTVSGLLGGNGIGSLGSVPDD
jgi:hypothetical protein